MKAFTLFIALLISLPLYAADLGRWTGGTLTQGNAPETWTNTSGWFPTQQRNDDYSLSSDTITLPSTGLADGYLFVAAAEYVITDNSRFMPQLKIIQASGTGTFIGGPTGGYARDNSENVAFMRAWGFVDGPSASATFRTQWKADSDDATGGTADSVFEVIPLYYADFATLTSSTVNTCTGTTPSQITGWSGTTGTNITLASNVVTVAGDNKRYLMLGSQYNENGLATRTQRWGGFRVDSTVEEGAKGYAYYRDASNDENGFMFSHLLETSTADVDIDQYCFRGSGVTAGLGGADVGGTTVTAATYTWAIIELHDSAEVFQSDTGAEDATQDLNVTGPVDIDIVDDNNINDAASFTVVGDSGYNVESSTAVLVGANISAAQEVVGTTSRWTSRVYVTVNGVEYTDSWHGNYARNNQGSIDTFGFSGNLLGYVQVDADQDLGISVQEHSGGEDGGEYRIQADWGSWWGINLDTMEDVAAPTDEQAIIISANDEFYDQVMNR